MKRDEVPQYRNRVLAGARKAVYAVDENGEIGAVASTGWEVEEIVTTLALDDFRLHADEALARARRAETSPLEYHMYAQRMDLPTLAQSVGLQRWRVRRHLRSRTFARLSPALLRRYAEALGISVDALRRLPGQ
ncbi:hypothetical protein [Acidihalobacter ferrooxydans]|uniref:HTH cro/C1-type domain-containing protein n=1 Tax=Acidihalobacter ferrooxydans TaxID=1765967 RepID=A0A1P8UDV7_9GAMM|nr:hypothetical protein [Acidihalobacter ferrooxydans]APZ42047.1 hypothetical protein BW247_02165 [Acidihalobacter ferrooxydans]